MAVGRQVAASQVTRSIIPGVTHRLHNCGVNIHRDLAVGGNSATEASQLGRNP